MKEPGKPNSAAILVVLVIGCALGKPQQIIAQRPYPPPKANKAPTQPHATPIGGNPRAGSGAPGNYEDASDTAAMLLRRLRATELAEDFERLARINREKIAPLASSTIFDYKELSQTVAEINKRAKRIKSNSPILLKEKKVEKASYAPDVANVGTLLPELARLIERFLGSTVFRVTSVTDDEPRTTAGSDLEGIIRLSDTINKIAKRLAKTSTRSA